MQGPVILLYQLRCGDVVRDVTDLSLSPEFDAEIEKKA